MQTRSRDSRRLEAGQSLVIGASEYETTKEALHTNVSGARGPKHNEWSHALLEGWVRVGEGGTVTVLTSQRSRCANVSASSLGSPG